MRKANFSRGVGTGLDVSHSKPRSCDPRRAPPAISRSVGEGGGNAAARPLRPLSPSPSPREVLLSKEALPRRVRLGRRAKVRAPALQGVPGCVCVGEPCACGRAAPANRQRSPAGVGRATGALGGGRKTSPRSGGCRTYPGRGVVPATRCERLVHNPVALGGDQKKKRLLRHDFFVSLIPRLPAFR